MLSDQELQAVNTIFRLLRVATSLQVAGAFLKGKGLSFSAGSWDNMISQRLMPALNEGHVTVAELRALLQSAEESGRQHTFLYQCPPARAAAMLAPVRLQAIVADAGLAHLFSSPLDLELPDTPTIVDIRGIAAADAQEGDSLLIKQVERRTTRVFLGEKIDTENNRMSREYSLIHKRAVNVARLYASGLLEIRIASQDNSTRYHENVKVFFSALSPILKRSEFSDISLSNAKHRLWNDEEELKKKIRYSQSIAKNDQGFSLSVSSATQEEDISDDNGSKAALHEFLNNDGRIVATNIYFRIPDADPAREVHVLLGGEVNEFAIPVACTAGDQDYVRRTIQSLNT